MKKNNFLGTCLFIIALSFFICSAEKLIIQKGSGILPVGFGNNPQIAVKVLQNGENIIPEEYDLKDKFKGFEGFMNITDYPAVIHLTKPGSSVEIIAKVFGGNLAGGALRYFIGNTLFHNVIVPKVSEIKIKINLNGKNVEFENIPFEYKDTPSHHNRVPYAGVFQSVPASESENDQDWDAMAGF